MNVPMDGWLRVRLVLLAGSGIACGRTHLTLTGSAGADADPSRRPIADAALPSDLAPALWPDLAPPLGPDLAPDLRKPICGNGWLDPGEECDDGNTNSGDGCGSSCIVEYAPPCPRPPCQPLVICGDGVLGPGEACDDGNIEKGDGCSDVCMVEAGFRCVVPGRRCTPICGDRMIVGTEDCDDGNSASGDGCSELCLTEDCWDCTSGACFLRPPVVDGGSCHGLPGGFCGDGLLQGAEECDAGAENSDGAYGGCSTHCQYLVCGDGIVNGAEACDLGTAENTAVYGDHTGCTSACALPHFCGDWYVDAAWGEDCDNGSLNGQSLCTQYCRIWMP
jgi:cysteine-rich repeat protein